VITFEYASGPEGAVFCPVVICDVCRLQVTAGAGTVYWFRLIEGAAWDPPDVYHACDGLARWLNRLTRNTSTQMVGHAP
jgi:hypothetical protein